MHSRRESATWGFTGEISQKSFKRSRKPLPAPPELPRIVHLGVFTPIFRQDDSWKAPREVCPLCLGKMCGALIDRSFSRKIFSLIFC